MRTPASIARRIARRVDLDQLLLADLGVALVGAVRGAAVGQEVLGGGGDPAGGECPPALEPALQALDHRCRVGGHDLRGLAVALVGAAPAVVAGDGQGRREGPVEAGDRHLLGRGLADAADEVRVAGGTEADIVREDGGADDVVVAVHRVDAEDGRDRGMARPALGGHGTERVRERQPFGGRGAVVAAGRGVAAGQDRAQRVVAQVLRRDGADVGLDHLADLLLEAEALHQLGDEGLGPGVGQALRARGPRPLLRMGGFGPRRNAARRQAGADREAQHAGQQPRGSNLGHGAYLPDDVACDRRDRAADGARPAFVSPP